ncbi:YlmC/YmxH family sporulation protein [Bacillaceae bacterium W0354]
MLLSELQSKDIINVDNGEKIGFISDLELDVHYGKILSLVVTIKGKWFGILGQEEEVLIQWHHIKKIGTDVILISMPYSKEQNQ